MVVKETAEVFRENAEARAVRGAEFDQAALAQFAAEFGGPRRTWFDSFIDAVNRIPRPLMALSVLALFASAMWAPIWFAERMQGLALVPEPMWWLAGVIVSFYFGARHQAKAQDFQRSIAETMARTPQVVGNIATLRKLRSDSPGAADTGTDIVLTTQSVENQGDNPALAEWRGKSA